MTWTFEQAQKNFDELFTLSIEEGPQLIGFENRALVMLDEGKYDRLVEERRKRDENLSTGANSEADE